MQLKLRVFQVHMQTSNSLPSQLPASMSFFALFSASWWKSLPSLSVNSLSLGKHNFPHDLTNTKTRINRLWGAETCWRFYSFAEGSGTSKTKKEKKRETFYVDALMNCNFCKFYFPFQCILMRESKKFHENLHFKFSRSSSNSRECAVFIFVNK